MFQKIENDSPYNSVRESMLMDNWKKYSSK